MIVRVQDVPIFEMTIDRHKEGIERINRIVSIKIILILL